MKNKKMMLGAVALGVVVLVFVGMRVFSGKTPSNQSDQANQESTDAFNEDQMIPTVDSLVKVTLVRQAGSREVSLSVSGIPKGTSSIDYELSYQTQQQGLQGVIGTIQTSDGEKSYEKNITLGTCSSGTCVYHVVVGSIKLQLRFTGDYGEKIFEKDFDINK